MGCLFPSSLVAWLVIQSCLPAASMVVFLVSFLSSVSVSTLSFVLKGSFLTCYLFSLVCLASASFKNSNPNSSKCQRFTFQSPNHPALTTGSSHVLSISDQSWHKSLFVLRHCKCSCHGWMLAGSLLLEMPGSFLPCVTVTVWKQDKCSFLR